MMTFLFLVHSGDSACSNFWQLYAIPPPSTIKNDVIMCSCRPLYIHETCNIEWKWYQTVPLDMYTYNLVYLFLFQNEVKISCKLTFYYVHVVAVHCTYYQLHPWNVQYFAMPLTGSGCSLYIPSISFLKCAIFHQTTLKRYSYSGVCFYV